MRAARGVLEAGAVALPLTVLLACMLWVAYLTGHTYGKQEAREEYRSECRCGEERTCAFGDGVIGSQSCATYAGKNEWTRCEPDQRWWRRQ